MKLTKEIIIKAVKDYRDAQVVFNEMGNHVSRILRASKVLHTNGELEGYLLSVVYDEISITNDEIEMNLEWDFGCNFMVAWPLGFFEENCTDYKIAEWAKAKVAEAEAELKRDIMDKVKELREAEDEIDREMEIQQRAEYERLRKIYEK